MVKRFHDTEIWKQDWFIELEPEYKMLWLYVKDACDHAGIWKPNKQFPEFVTGKPLDLEKALKLFNDGKERIVILKNGRWFIPEFCGFQYGKKVNLKNRLHSSIADIFRENGIRLTSSWGQVVVKLGSTRGPHDLKLRSRRGQVGVKHGPKDKDIVFKDVEVKDVEVEVKDVDVKKESRREKDPASGDPPAGMLFEHLWALYPRREGKKEALRHFCTSVKTNQDRFDIQRALDNYIEQLRKNATTLEYTKMGSTWFNNWRDYVNFQAVNQTTMRPAPPAQKPKVPDREPTEEERLEAIRVFEEVKKNLKGSLKTIPTVDKKAMSKERVLVL